MAGSALLPDCVRSLALSVLSPPSIALSLIEHKLDTHLTRTLGQHHKTRLASVHTTRVPRNWEERPTGRRL